MAKTAGRLQEKLVSENDKEIMRSIDLKIANGKLKSDYFKNTIVHTRQMTEFECRMYGVDYKKIVIKETTIKNKK